jgi:hypothetical protein
MILKKFWEYIEKSIIAGISNKVSTTRISSYLILASILATTIIYLIIDIVNAAIKWSHGQVFIISAESIVFFGMVLAHHLALLGINKNAETKQYLDFLKSTKESKAGFAKSINKKSDKDSASEDSENNIGSEDSNVSTGAGNEEENI